MEIPIVLILKPGIWALSPPVVTNTTCTKKKKKIINLANFAFQHKKNYLCDLFSVDLTIKHIQFIVDDFKVTNCLCIHYLLN